MFDDAAGFKVVSSTLDYMKAAATAEAKHTAKAPPVPHAAKDVDPTDTVLDGANHATEVCSVLFSTPIFAEICVCVLNCVPWKLPMSAPVQPGQVSPWNSVLLQVPDAKEVRKDEPKYIVDGIDDSEAQGPSP